MKTVLVSGANGFIGRHLVDKLLIENKKVFAITNKDKNYFSGEVISIKIDLLNKEEINGIISTIKDRIDVFYHCAWNGVAPEYKMDAQEQIKNISIGLNALYFCHEIGCRNFINLGTVAEYVKNNGLINGQCVPSPADLYGATKTAVRYILQAYAHSMDIIFINTILCSTYGEFRNDDNIISYSIKKILKGEKPIYGDLDQIWDFLYVKDVAKALFCIGEIGLRKEDITYSIGSGIFMPIFNYIIQIRDLINPELPLGIGEIKQKYKNIKNSCVDTFLLQSNTGFIPDYSFKEGIKKTIKYFRETIKN
jgi:nucleoside-diphosphate-sugar epimerase